MEVMIICNSEDSEVGEYVKEDVQEMTEENILNMEIFEERKGDRKSMAKVIQKGTKEHEEEFPLTPMGVLAHRLRTLDRSLVPPSA